MSDELEGFGNWDLIYPLISARSQLYNIEPLDVTTPYVESLGNYFRRLAAAHAVTPSHLFTEVVGPLTGKAYLSKGDSGWYSMLGKHFRYATMNGVGKMTSDCVSCLEQLTLRNDLSQLTMLHWSQVLSDQELFHPTTIWCARCFSEWRLKDEAIREVLIWTLRPVLICTRHLTGLSTRCPHCNRVPRPLFASSRLGYCSFCSGWLGVAGVADKPLSETLLRWQGWICDKLGEMLVAAAMSKRQPSLDRIRQVISFLIDRFHNGSSAAFASYLGRSKTTVWTWTKSNHKMRITDLLAVCNSAKLTPIEFLLLDNAAIEQKLDQRPRTPGPEMPSIRRPTRRVARRLDKDRIRAQLEAIRSSANMPKTWREVEESVKVEASHLRRLFPELCRLLGSDIKQANASGRTKRAQERRRSVEQAVIKLRGRGVHPTRRLVCAELNTKGVFRIIH
jgi:hypothetical protein